MYSTRAMIQPGEWVSIYGSGLANATAIWTGNFPASLGGTSVTINGKPAYLSLVVTWIEGFKKGSEFIADNAKVFGGGFAFCHWEFLRFDPHFPAENC